MTYLIDLLFFRQCQVENKNLIVLRAKSLTTQINKSQSLEGGENFHTKFADLIFPTLEN